MLTLGNKIIAGSFKSGASWEVGDVGISALGIDESLNKRRYLNGQVISQTQFVQFTAFLKSRVSVYPSLATTEVNWQAAVTNSDLGQCGQFVIDDDAGTIRLPKVVNIQGLFDLTGLGTTVEAGLPNIEGSAKGANTNFGILYSDAECSGALYRKDASLGVYQAINSTDGRILGFDASLSNPIYGNSSTVQPESIQYPYFIQVAEGIENSVDVSREIELNNPFSLLDYKYSEYEISNASWLLSNGQFNSGSVYQSVYDLLLQELNGTSNKLPYRSYVNTVGNVVDTNGVLSGFSASDYAELPEIFDGNAPWERVLKFTTGKVTTNQVIWGNNGDHRGFQVYIRTDGKFTMSGSSNNSTWNLFDVTSTTALTANTTYYLRVIYDGSKYTQEISTDGINYNLEGTANVATPVTTTTIRLGTHGGAPFSGSIDLNESYININGERWWTGRRKIITTTGDYTDEDYRLNTTDTTFRLPIKVLMAGSKRVAGNGMTLGLTDGTTNAGIISGVDWNGSDAGGNVLKPSNPDYGKTVGSASTMPGYSRWGNDKLVGITTDETKSGIETSANGLYLYFYVGETIQDANIIAAAGVLTDVADLKAHSIVETYVNGTSWYRVYSDGWCEQGGLNLTSQDSGNNSAYTISIPLLIEMADNNYTGFLQAAFGGGSSWNGPYRDESRSTTSTAVFTGWVNGSCTVICKSWMVCGYKA